MKGDSVKTGLYRHFKGGRYVVLGTATHSETEEEMVLYHPEHEPERLWVRPRAMFCEQVEREGISTPRFQLMGETGSDR